MTIRRGKGKASPIHAPLVARFGDAVTIDAYGCHWLGDRLFYSDAHGVVYSMSLDGEEVIHTQELSAPEDARRVALGID